MATRIGTSGDDRLVGTAGRDTLVGREGSDLLDDGGGGPDEMIGGAGDDTYLVGDASDSIVEYAGEGLDTVRTGLARYTLRDHLERLVYTGSVAFTGFGNAGDNVLAGSGGDDALYGLAGRDVLIGGAGADRLSGGAGAANELYGGVGDDTYMVEASDSIVERAGEGHDRVLTALATHTLAAEVEDLFYTGAADFRGRGNALGNQIAGAAGADVLSGDAGDDLLFGRDGRDVLVGGVGNDRLYGGAGAANELYGGAGDDTYVVEAVGDSIVEAVDGGEDRVVTGLGVFRLAANVETLFFTGDGDFRGIGNDAANTLYGNNGNDQLYGGGGFDVLYGGMGDDLLDGGAGDGASRGNVLYGGPGDDTYVVTQAIEYAYERPGEGNDAIRTTLAQYRLPADFENLAFIGAGAFRGNGNAVANIITGGAGDDILGGLDGDDVLGGGEGRDYLVGGTGNDLLSGGEGAANALQGGTGDDTYVLSAVGDSVIEFADEGRDRVITAFATYRLPASVEVLEFTNAGGAVGYGNAGTNQLTGGSGSDTLYGLDGSDTLSGGDGDDVLDGGTGYDSLDGGEGDDRLYGGDGGGALYGGNGVDRLEGGAGSDRLEGGGESDTLIGGAGDDFYTNSGANLWPPFDTRPAGLSGREAIVEAPGGGIDTVEIGSVRTYRMPDNVENIVPIVENYATRAERLAGPAVVIGNASDNVIQYGENNPTLYGGDGNDRFEGYSTATIIGGNGNDTYHGYSRALLQYNGGETGIDTLASEIGKVELSRSYYLPTDNYYFIEGRGAFATGASSTFIRDTATNLVSFDPDGRGPAAAVPLLYYAGSLSVDDFGFF